MQLTLFILSLRSSPVNEVHHGTIENPISNNKEEVVEVDYHIKGDEYISSFVPPFIRIRIYNPFGTILALYHSCHSQLIAVRASGFPFSRYLYTLLAALDPKRINVVIIPL